MIFYDDVNISNVTCESDFDISSIGKEPTALYVIVPDEDKTYYVLITIIVGLLYKELTKLANKQDNKKLPVQIDWLLDEFANCPPLSDIEAIVSVARSRGMRFHFFIQSFAQLDNVYGKDVARIILDNCGLVYLKTNTQETAELISKRLGKQTITSNSISESNNSINGSRSTSLISRDLFTPDEIKQLHYKMIIFPIVGYPIYRDTILYNRFKCYESGSINRVNHPLKELSSTFFTVEKIVNKKINEDVIESNSFMEEIKKNSIDRFSNIRNDFISILKKEKYNINYIEKNYQYYMQIKTDKRISKYHRQSMESKYKDFHMEYDIKDVKYIVNVYFK